MKQNILLSGLLKAKLQITLGMNCDNVDDHANIRKHVRNFLEERPQVRVKSSQM